MQTYTDTHTHLLFMYAPEHLCKPTLYAPEQLCKPTLLHTHLLFLYAPEQLCKPTLLHIHLLFLYAPEKSITARLLSTEAHVAAPLLLHGAHAPLTTASWHACPTHYSSMARIFFLGFLLRLLPYMFPYRHAIFLCVLQQGITALLIHGGPWLPFYLCGFMMAISLFVMTIYPTFIQPLFNKVEPLPEGSLRTKIEALVSTKIECRDRGTGEHKDKSAEIEALVSTKIQR